MAKTITLKPEEQSARSYADRLILEQLFELESAIKLGELAEKLSAQGLGLAAVRSLLASNPERFVYHDRRWIPAARVEAEGRPLAEVLRLTLDRFGGPMPVAHVVAEATRVLGQSDQLAEKIARTLALNPVFVVADDLVALAEWAFLATDETVERALALNGLTEEEVETARKKVGDIDWRSNDAVAQALAKAAPISAKALGAVAWQALNSQDPTAVLLYEGPALFAQMITTPGYIYGADGTLHAAADSKKWLAEAAKVAEKIAPTVDVEDAAPIDVKADDVKKMVAKIAESDSSVTATKLLEDMYEITPSNRTFEDDLANVVDALRSDSKVWWVGEDRFRKPNSAPDYIYSVPELFEFKQTSFKDEEGDLIDVELTDDGLSSTLRKLLAHPLATDVLDEDLLQPLREPPKSVRLVLKSIHRELGTFPMCQIPNGFLNPEPNVQELIFVDPSGRELQVWANHEARLLYNLIDWWYEQPVESGAVFSLVKSTRPNVYEFQWDDQTDPVIYISSQRMEELRELQGRAEGMSTLDILIEVMGHWPKGADFLTLLAEVNVVRRSTRRLVASLLSSYQCFYQRSGSPVWHFDGKKVELGFDKTKKKFIKK